MTNDEVGPPLDTLPLTEDHLDLWYVRCDKATEAGLLDAYRRLLSPDELARAMQFSFESGRNQALLTRALVRTVLSRYSGHDPRAWVFCRNSYGKPSVAEPAGLALRLNVSHTEGMVICAVGAGHDVGVDVEDLQRRRVNPALARRFFAASEVEALEKVSQDQRRTAFLEFWTLKEAYIKARGMGLAIPLADFAFTLSGDRPPAIRFTASHRQRPEDWQFAQICLSERYQIATAVRYAATERLTISLRETVPLRYEGDVRILPPEVSKRWFLDFQ